MVVVRKGRSRYGRPLAGLAIALLLLLSGCAAAPVQGDAHADWTRIWETYPELDGRIPEAAVVKRVVDGDTFETDTGAKVRLVGADTPETHGKVEAYGKEASAFAKRELTGKRVWLFRDVSETDRYGRLLRYAFLEGDPVMFNERLVREGYANVMTISPDVAMAGRFIEAERTARGEGRGLWAAAGEDAAPQAASEERDAEPSCPSPDIKGNINSKGERIYHVPGSRSYKQTKPEMWFCTEEEAERAGFRAPIHR